MKPRIRTIKIKTKNTRSAVKSTNNVPIHKTSKISVKKSKNNLSLRAKKLTKSILLSKTFQFTAKTLTFLFLISSFSYGAYALVGSAIAEDVIVSKSEIVNRVTRFVTLPEGVPQAVVRVENPETLKKQNSFYESVKEGDYILVYDRLAIIYDLRNDSVVSIKKSDR